MHLKRLTLPFACLLFATLGVGAASAQQTFLLGGNSGGQLQIGGGLPLPIQLTDANMDMVADWGAVPTMVIMAGSIPATSGVGASVFPPLLIPRKAGAQTVNTDGMGGLSIPAGVLSLPAKQNTIGVNSQNPTLHAVATNLNYLWPAKAAMLSARTMTQTIGGGAITLPSNPTTAYKANSTVGPGTGRIRYVNQGQPFFGGFGNFVISPKTGSAVTMFPATMGPLKTSVGVTVYGIVPPTPPPCTGCGAILVKAAPAGSQAPGGKALQAVFTVGGGVAPPNVYGIKAGPSPRGTISVIFGPAATATAPNNMASSNGFFWTTGRITVSVPGAAGVPENFVLSGSDGRTAGGAGTIQLVSGSLSQRAFSGPNANRGWVRLELESGTDVPSLSSAGLAALSASLLAVAVFAMVRRRARA